MALPHDDQELLSRILHFCHGELLEHPTTQDALRTLGLVDANLLISLGVGLAAGNLHRMFPEDEAILATAKALGFLEAQGRDRFGHHLLVPLRASKGHLAGYGAIDLQDASETITLFEPSGCLYPSELQKAKRACLATSVLNALLLAQAHEKAVVVALPQALSRHLARLSDFAFKEAILALEPGPLLTACAQTLAAQGIEPLAFPPGTGQPVRELLKAGAELEVLLQRVVPVALPSVEPQTEVSDEGLQVTWPDRSWRVRLVDPHRFDHLKVSLKLTKDHRWHLDTVDLSLAKQRQAFLHMAKKVVRIEPAVLYQDLLTITEAMERYQADRVLAHKQAATVMNEEAARDAAQFLKDVGLCDRLLEDLTALGWAGDPRCALIGYLTLTSRKLERPLAVAWAEGAETLNLADLLLPLLPEEDLVYLTRPSPKALLYQEAQALEHRVIAAETNALSSDTFGCLLRLSRGQALHAQVVVREAQTGRLKTVAHHVRGPCALFLTVSKRGPGAQRRLPGAPFLPLRIPDTVPASDQLDWAAQQEDVRHLETQSRRQRLIAKHRAVQRLLTPCAVVNPHAQALRASEQDPVRYQRLIGLARAIAFLRQRQKSVQAHGRCEYVEVGEDDLALAATLLATLCDGGWPPPHAPSQRVLEVIQRQVQGEAGADFTRTQVRAWTGLGEHVTREYLERLEADGYLERLDGSVGRAFRYRLSASVPPRPFREGEGLTPQPADPGGVAAGNGHLALCAPGYGHG